MAVRAQKFKMKKCSSYVVLLLGAALLAPLADAAVAAVTPHRLVGTPPSGNAIGDGAKRNHEKFTATNHLRHSEKEQDERLLESNLFTRRRSCWRICRRKEDAERCLFLCRCFRKQAPNFANCSSKEDNKKRRRCMRRRCRKLWKKEEEKGESTEGNNGNTNTNSEVAATAPMAVVGRQLSSDAAVYRSSSGGPFAVAMLAFNPDGVPETYHQCSDLYDDIRAAAALLCNVLIVNQVKQDMFMMHLELQREQPFAEDVTVQGAPLDSIEINEDSFETNVQEENVKEADVIKSDGTNVFAAYRDVIVVWDAVTGDILSRTDFPTIKTANSTKTIWIEALLLHDNRLVVITSQSEYTRNSHLLEQPILSRVGTLQILVYDADPNNVPTDGSPLTLVGTKYLRGRYIASRSIGNTAHIVHMSHIDTHTHLNQHLYRYNERYEGMNDTQYFNEAAKVALEYIDEFATKLIDEIVSEAGQNCSNVAEITVFSSPDEASNETNSTNSSRPEELLGEEGILRSYLQISSFNIENGTDLDGNLTVDTTSLFYNGTDAIVYASEDYLTAASQGWWQNWFDSGWDQTTFLMGFKLQEDGSAAVPWGTGLVPGRVKDQYSMDECGGYLRIATTSSARFACVNDFVGASIRGCDFRLMSNSTSQLMVLRLPGDENGTMEEVGRVEDLGITEDIKSVRYIDCDKAFIVTFLTTDPLYAINLTDAHNPFAQGELKITGFSNYMHPYPKDNETDDRLLMIGVGQDANNETGRQEGLQVSFFDLTNMSDPSLLHRYSVGKGYSDAEFDPKSFRFLEQARVLLLPVSINSDPFDGFFVISVTTEGIEFLFNVSMADSSQISRGCWYNAQMPPRSLVFEGNGTFVKAHSYKSVELTESVKLGKEVVRWNNTLDPPNMRKEMCCGYWCIIPLSMDVMPVDSFG